MKETPRHSNQLRVPAKSSSLEFVMYINRLKRQLGAPGNIPPPSGDPAGAPAPPPVQAWAPPPVGQPVPPGSQAPPVWSPPGQVVPGRPAKPPASGDTTAANQLPNGVDPAAYNSMFGEPTQPLDLVSDKVPSTRTNTHYSRTTKGDMAAGILVLIFLAGLATWTIIHYRRGKMRRNNAEGNVSKTEPADIEGIVPEAEGGGQFRVKTEMQEVKEPEQPEPVYGSFQTHRNGRQKSHPIYSIRNPRPNLRKPKSAPRPGTPTPPLSPALSPAKERYYYRDRYRWKPFKDIGRSSRE
ncbi:hypothetical protein TWF102_003359 [Orbilia oligospora]|uniref:Uncharacterized protein n=1 Tax=Orbilia oligospora TaxID=2813651 RepID=A0A7C8JIA1_ORBOL|nr:hypothetical protein TWF103_002288 [Orbilia oligospora]KAF3103977.1 hypothetical protein TWF102_003359 [Orbilia oligospora]KAF3138041.1 hypothetical protein TWF594_007298 [Orbilia oligospora]